MTTQDGPSPENLSTEHQKEGDARLADMNYLDRQSLRQGSDRFYYEKRMLAEWFTRTFGGTS